MNLEVRRDIRTANSTAGQLFIDGQFECFTLEPRADQSQGKPFCIPAGTYQLVLQWSPHFHTVTAHLLDVPGFEAVEIHPGNFVRDTHGCTLVGKVRNDTPDYVGESIPAFQALMAKLQTLTSITYID